MAHSHRRQFLKDLLGTLAKGAGIVVLASAAPARATAQAPDGQNTDIQQRADGLAGADGADDEASACNFVNRAFRNGASAAFRNGGFRNAGVSAAFRNGGFRNGSVGAAFRN